MRQSIIPLLFLTLLTMTFLLAGCGDKEPPCDQTCENLSYECGTHVFCGGPQDCGKCAEGLMCVKNTCEPILEGKTYYVATDGDDANPGTIEEPWVTFQQGILHAKPGDTVYLRGGVYYHNDSFGGNPFNGVGYSGTPDAYVKFWNYPGERPIFDFSGHEVDPHTGWTGSIGWHEAQYIHLRGFTVRNVHQTPPNFTREWKPYSEGHGLGCTQCANMIYENLVVHDIDGRGFQHWSGAWNDFDAEYSVEHGNAEEYPEPVFESDTTYFINNDAYNLYDRYDDTPGNAADGWKVETYYGGTFVWEGNRAWNYSDDGFDPHGSGLRIFRNNWAMPTDKYEGLSEAWSPEANGYKTTAIHLTDTPDDEHGVIFSGNIAAFGTGSGFIANLALHRSTNRYPQNTLVYNNLAYKMGIGFTDGRLPGEELMEPSSTYYNNIAYKPQSTEATGQPYEVYMYRIPTIESNNTWIGHPRSGDWWWQYNPQINVTDDDFISLDYSELATPRRSDFTLPDIEFGHLAPDSDLIDAGIVIPGYHCDTPGRHEEDCVEWTGEAPDLGPFEYGLEPETVCRGEDTRECAWEDGVAYQKRTCIGPGEWSDFGACELAACDQGYTLQDGDCVIGPGWSKELLYNPSFEGSADGWTSTGNWKAQEYRIWGYVVVPHEGHYTAYNKAKSNESTFLYQDVDITDYAEYTDAGKLVMNASGWAKEFKAAIKFTYLDENKNNISTALDTGYQEHDDWWSGSVEEEPVPVGTRYVRAWGNAYHLFTNQAGYLDDFSVKVKVIA